MISQPNHVSSALAPLSLLIEKRESENGPVLQRESAEAKLLSGEMVLAAASKQHSAPRAQYVGYVVAIVTVLIL